MSSPTDTSITHTHPTRPFYIVVDGFRLPGIFLPEMFRSAKAYKPRSDDLFIATFPKCGTTWVQNIVGCIFRGGKTFSSGLEFFTDTQFLEFTGGEAAETMRRPGAIKIHLPFNITPYSPQAKYIFIARNPMDCCVSFYYHTKNFPGYEFCEGEFDDYFELFIEGQTDFGDYFDTLLSWYEHRNDPNVLFLTYEKLKKDTRKGVLKIAEFIDPQYKVKMETNKQFLDDVIHHSSFKFMQEHMNKCFAEFSCLSREMVANNPDIPDSLKNMFMSDIKLFHKDPSNVTFVRKGVVGDWRNHFSPMQHARMMKKFRDRTVGTDIADLWKDDM